MNIILHSFLLIVCGVIAAVWVDAAPFYYLPSTYSFDGLSNNVVSLSDLVSVKGNNARSIQFQMMTSFIPATYSYYSLIGMIMKTWLIIYISKPTLLLF